MNLLAAARHSRDADPSRPPSETERRSTRSLLERLVRAGYPGGLAISTTSPLILRDLELLAGLDRYGPVTVEVAIPTLSAELARWVEPPDRAAPSPAERLEVVRALAAEGISTTVVYAPVRAAINDGADSLRPLLAAAWQAGADDVRHMRGRNRQRFAELFARLRLQYGFPRARPGRG